MRGHFAGRFHVAGEARRLVVLATMLVGMALLVTACGTSGSDLQQGSAGQYSISVTATTASGATRTATLPLTVK